MTTADTNEQVGSVAEAVSEMRESIAEAVEDQSRLWADFRAAVMAKRPKTKRIIEAATALGLTADEVEVQQHGLAEAARVQALIDSRPDIERRKREVEDRVKHRNTTIEGLKRQNREDGEKLITLSSEATRAGFEAEKQLRSIRATLPDLFDAELPVTVEPDRVHPGIAAKARELGVAFPTHVRTHPDSERLVAERRSEARERAIRESAESEARVLREQRERREQRDAKRLGG